MFCFDNYMIEFSRLVKVVDVIVFVIRFIVTSNFACMHFIRNFVQICQISVTVTDII